MVLLGLHCYFQVQGNAPMGKQEGGRALTIFLPSFGHHIYHQTYKRTLPCNPKHMLPKGLMYFPPPNCTQTTDFLLPFFPSYYP